MIRGSSHTPITPKLGGVLDCLLGDVSFSSDSDFILHAVQLVPPHSFDYLLRIAEYAMDTPAKPY